MSQTAMSFLFALYGAACFVFPLNAYSATGASSQLSADVTPGCDLMELAQEVQTVANRTFDSRLERLRQDELRRVGERAQRCPGAELILAQVLHSRAMCYAMEWEMEKAESFYKRAVELLERSAGGERLLATALVSLAIHYRTIGQLDVAWRSSERAIRLLEAHAPDQRSDRVKADVLLAVLLTDRAQFSKAKRVYRRVIANIEGMDLGQDVDPFLLVALLNYSQLVLHTDPSESEKALDLVSGMLQEKDSEWSRLKAWAGVARGRLEYFRGNSASGLSTAMEGLELARSVLPPEHSLLAYFNGAVGELHFLSKNHAEAAALFAQASQTWEILGNENEFARGTLERYAEILRKQGKKVAAKALVRRLQDMNKSKDGVRRANTIDVMTISSQSPHNNNK